MKGDRYHVCVCVFTFQSVCVCTCLHAYASGLGMECAQVARVIPVSDRMMLHMKPIHIGEA